LWDPKNYPYSFKEEFVSVLCCDTLLVGSQYRHLTKFVHDHKYIVITMLVRREGRHIFHGYGFPQLVESRQRSVQAFLLDGWLGDGVGSARYDIFPNILLEFGPIKELL